MRISDWISDVCSSDLGCLSFDYHPAEGSLWGQKIRYKISETAKTFSFPHADGKPPLWLMHKWGTGCDTRSLVIFEGEGDAASYYKLTGGKYPVVPVPNGAKGSLDVLKNHYEWLERFGKHGRESGGERGGQDGSV